MLEDQVISGISRYNYLFFFQYTKRKCLTQNASVKIAFYILHKCATCSKNKWLSRASFLPSKVPDFNSY